MGVADPLNPTVFKQQTNKHVYTKVRSLFLKKEKTPFKIKRAPITVLCGKWIRYIWNKGELGKI